MTSVQSRNKRRFVAEKQAPVAGIITPAYLERKVSEALHKAAVVSSALKEQLVINDRLKDRCQVQQFKLNELRKRPPHWVPYGIIAVVVVHELCRYYL